MEKIKISVLVDYIEVNGIYNNEIYYHDSSWTDLGLAICKNCGTLFAYSFLKHRTKDLTEDLTDGKHCPNCKENLIETIEKYPDTFIMNNGNIGHFKWKFPLYTTDKEERWIEVWKLI